MYFPAADISRNLKTPVKKTRRNINIWQGHILYAYMCTERKSAASEHWTRNLAITSLMRYPFTLTSFDWKRIIRSCWSCDHCHIIIWKVTFWLRNCATATLFLVVMIIVHKCERRRTVNNWVKIFFWYLKKYTFLKEPVNSELRLAVLNL